MKSYMKHNMPVSAGLVVLAVLMALPACSKKKSEEDITITLRTEAPAPVVSPASPSSTTVRPARPPEKGAVPHKKSRSTQARHRAVKPVSKPVPGGAPVESRAAPARTQVAVNVPPAVKQPSPADAARQQILAIIGRQRSAMASKNIDLALRDIAGNHDQNRRALQDYFDRYKKISVDFSNISIDVSGGTATAVMDQRTSIVTRGFISQTVTELTRVQWTFVNTQGRWLITGTRILSKMGQE